MGRLDELLTVQEHDLAADRLRHRLETLPERAALAGVEQRLTALETVTAELRARRDDVARRQQGLEDELAAVEQRITDVEKRMYSGAVTAPRELQAMQADAESLRRRRSALEDEVLEAMGEREPLDAELDERDAERAALDDEGGRLRAAVAEAEAAIERDLADELAARGAAAAGADADLLERYEELRAKLGGIGAARLENGRCGGCHLALSATELDRIKREPPDTLVLCEQCGRILVR